MREEEEAALSQQYADLQKQVLDLQRQLADLQRKEELRAANTTTKGSGLVVAAGPGPGSAAAGVGTSPVCYKNITVYVPDGYSKYRAHTLQQTTKEQLRRMLAGTGNCRVLRVDEEPPLLLRYWCYEDLAEDIFYLELRDGMQLAVVVDTGYGLPPKRSRPVFDGDEEDAEFGWLVGSVPAEDFVSEWAMSRLAGDQGLLRFRLKEISGKVVGGSVAFGVDCLATSSSRAVLVVRTPRITFEYVEEVAEKGKYLGELAEFGVPIAKPLLDPDTDEIKPLELYLMADGWVEDPEEQAACAVQMHELGIMPVLPHKGAYTVGSGGRPWPPQEGDLRLADLFRARKDEEERQRRVQWTQEWLQQRQQATSGDADGAASCGTGGEAWMSVPDTYWGSRAGKAACSSDLGGLPRTCPPGRLGVAVGQRRSLAPARLVLPARLPRLYASGSRAVVRGL